MSKKVFVINKSDFFNHCYYDIEGIENLYGLIVRPNLKNEFTKLFNNGFMKNREEAEHDSNYKQIIPYIVLKTIIDNEEKFLLTFRKNTQTEIRLHNKYSIGIGGHIDSPDADNVNSNTYIFYNAMYRELFEETDCDIDNIKSVDCVGLINSEADEVSQVHLGVLVVMELYNKVAIKEKDKMDGIWVNKNELKNIISQSEAWTKLVINYLI